MFQQALLSRDANIVNNGKMLSVLIQTNATAVRNDGSFKPSNVSNL